MSTGKFLGFVAIAISLYILWQIRQVLLLAFLAIALATVINRLVQLLQKFKIKRGIAVTISVILVLALFVGFIAIIVPSIIDQWQQLVNIESDILTPLVMKNQVSLLPAITLLSQVTFAIFFGALGLFLALPIIIVAQVWLKELLVKDILNHWENPRQNSNSNFSDARENQANKYS
ncbi:MAG: AI-2E family transporter [Oscillatoria sp. PMC 1051.18]|nr:AI-2E family transporter [Oscillatoria sp. PMC 1050.18]MEC5029431.1 AI-2E family transporter [Oscillatoria sp. PMC 1051.18]